MGSIPRVLAVLISISCLSGCFSEDYGTPGMYIWNRTSAAVDVSYRRDIGGVETEDDVVHVAPNQRVLVIGLHQTEGPCLRGTVIAVHGERTVATLAQPCEGVEWIITPTDA